MDAVTYPHEKVKQELAGHWLTARFDVSESKPVATSFGVSAIPVAIVLTGDGAVRSRILGFVEPERFAKELETLRRAR